MNKKGFTLIELLAVIVILAIIALIATPAVLNIIEDSKESAAKDSAMTIAKSAETYYVSNATLLGKEVGTIDLTTGELQYKGEKPEKGYVTFDDKGNSYLKMYMNGYCVVSDYDNTVVSEKMDSDECTMSAGSEISKKYTYYIDGTSLYFNPTDGVKCNPEDAVSTTGTKSGCMKFYTFLDTEDSEIVNLLLDHNTTLQVLWNNNQSATTPDTAKTQVENDTKGWKQIVDGVEIPLTGRLITASEVNAMAPRTDGVNWNINDEGTFYYLHNGIGSVTGLGKWYTGPAGTNKYAWLFDNIEDCETYGCNVEQDDVQGYWTSDYAGASYYAWLVNGYGALYTSSDLWYKSRTGVRPVIEVNKQIFE